MCALSEVLPPHPSFPPLNWGSSAPWPLKFSEVLPRRELAPRILNLFPRRALRWDIRFTYLMAVLKWKQQVAKKLPAEPFITRRRGADAAGAKGRHRGRKGGPGGPLVGLLPPCAEYWATVLSRLVGPASWEPRRRGKVEPNRRQWLHVLNLNHFLVLYLSWKWGPPFSPQNQYFNSDPIELGCSFLMFCTSGTLPVRTTGRLETGSPAWDGRRPAAEGHPAECARPSPGRPGSGSWHSPRCPWLLPASLFGRVAGAELEVAG